MLNTQIGSLARPLRRVVADQSTVAAPASPKADLSERRSPLAPRAARVTSTANSILAVDNLRVAYENPKTGDLTEAVGGVSLEIAASEFVTIVGLSGCGKSTLLSAVAGLVRPQSGTIAISGQPIDGPGPDRAVVFQRPSLLPWRSVIDNIVYGLELRGVSRREARTRAEKYIKLVELDGVEHFYPGALSGGMQQRVNLARALVCDPALLLLDEPFAALDAITRETMQDELLKIWEATQKAVLMVTHQIDEAVLLSDRVLVFSDRPATIIAEIIIDLPRPRGAEVRESSRFAELTSAIWSQIHATAAARAGARR